MAEIKFTREEKEQMVQKVKLYFQKELDQEIGSFDAEFLLDFFSREIGAYFYNRGLYDAQAILAAKIGEISDAIYEIEMPTVLR
jgi:uncharacterized protein (DUF2164 family)